MNRLCPHSFCTIAALALIVPSDNNARTWVVTPSESIQCYIDSSAAGDTIFVEPGNYSEALDYLGKDIVIRGSLAETTILDCSEIGGSCVTFKNGEGQGAVLEQMTITGGVGSAYENYVVGGGILILNAEPTIQDNVIAANSAEYYLESPGTSEFGRGAGIMCIGDNGLEWGPDIRRNEFLDNYSGTHGGGIGVLKSSAPRISDNYFFRNRARGRLSYASGNGGAIWIYGTAHGTTIANNIFEYCTAEGKGGAIYAAGFGQLSYLSVDINNNVFYKCLSENSTRERAIASLYGGLGGSAIWCGYIDARIENNTFVENDCLGSHANKHQGTLAFEGPGYYEIRSNLIALTDRGGGIACERGPTLQTENNLFWQNGDGDYPQCPDATDETNLLADPYFCDTNDLTDPGVAENSPALTSPNGPIGARTTPACEPVSYQQTTWGRLKQIYR